MSKSTNYTVITCPECNTEMIVDTAQLLAGVSFACFNCHLIFTPPRKR